MSTPLLLTNSYFYPFDKKQWEIKQPYPPLGTLFAAAWLRQHGFNVTLQDNCLNNNEHNIEEAIKESGSKYLIIYDDGFNYLTKMCLTRMRDAAYNMIAIAKTKGCIVIINSSDSTDHYKEYLQKGADYVIHGEGEVTLLELINALENNTSTLSIEGLSFLQNGESHKTLPRSVVKDLDTFPMPAWDLVDIEHYRKIWLSNHGYFSINLATTRGCPYKCNWCAKPIYGNRYNSRSPEKVMEEIEYLLTNYDVDYFWMCDDIFGLKPGWVQRLAELKQEKGIDFKYKIQSRVDLMLKDDNLDALVKSGLDMAWVGAESGSQKILDAMDKGTQVEQIYTATKMLKKHGARVAFFLQFGYLDETYNDIKQTLKMVLDLMPDDIGISVSYPLPGTKFYEKVKQDLVSKANWKDSDDLDLMFENTYPPVFYKTLHRYVHNRYRLKKGWMGFKSLINSPAKNTKEHLHNIARMVYHLPFAFTNKLTLSKYTNK